MNHNGVSMFITSLKYFLLYKDLVDLVVNTVSSLVSNLVSQASAASALKYGVVNTACMVVTSIFGQLVVYCLRAL